VRSDPGGIRNQRLILLAIGAFLFTAGLGLRDPWPADEPRFALVAREMVETGQWLIPHRAGEIYGEKPPLFFWAVAAVYVVTGSMRVSFLLPAAISGLIVVLLIHDLALRLWSRRAAFLTGLALLTSIQFVMQARSGQIDGFLVLWTTIALYGICRHLLAGPAEGWWYAGFAAAGAGVITKGVGFLPLLLLVPAAFTPARKSWNWRMVTVGLGLMLGVILLWLVPMLVYVESSQNPALEAYRDNILLRQTAQRYVDPWHHFEWPGYFVFEVIPWAWFPLTLALPWTIPAFRRRIARRDTRTIVLLGWVLLVLLFFSVSGGKRGVYILPALPAFVLAHTGMLAGLIRKASLQRTARAASAAFALVLTTLSLTLLARPGLLAERGIEEADSTVLAMALFLPAIAGAAAVLVSRRRAVAAFATVLGVLWLAIGWGVLPELDRDRSAEEFMDAVASRLGPRTELGILGWKEQFVLQAHHSVETFGYGRRDIESEAREGAIWLMRGKDRRLLLTGDHLPSCFDDSRASFVDQQSREEWYIAGPDAVRESCRR
jgi:4-amino-4-deoxy-L-arabinose transferase-like glycosyltransferase